MTPSKALITRQLTDARDQTLEVLAPFDDHDLTRQVSPLMSPLVWDLAHIAHYEELWLLRRLGGAPPSDPRFDDVYDAFKHPRTKRATLDILDGPGARAFATDVRDRVLEVLEAIDFSSDPLCRDAFVYGMVIQHEHQHRETMLATIQLMDRPYALNGDAHSPASASAETPVSEIAFDGGEFVMGTDSEPWAYDNERPAHTVALSPFRIDATPVTNAAYAEFVAEGGYRDDRLWTAPGWSWLQEAGVRHPQFWRRDGDATWCVTRFGRLSDLAPDEPVQHVSWFEADAFARWAGKRLPTEAEWEHAARAGDARRFPWGDAVATPTNANLGLARLGPSPVNTYPAGATPHGVQAMIGDVWEWTSTDFRGYPAFRSFPYREYSEVFFGPEYKVLRGGSWATDPLACRGTFRNWDFPIRRQIFAGFRCARDT